MDDSILRFLCSLYINIVVIIELVECNSFTRSTLKDIKFYDASHNLWPLSRSKPAADNVTKNSFLRLYAKGNFIKLTRLFLTERSRRHQYRERTLDYSYQNGWSCESDWNWPKLVNKNKNVERGNRLVSGVEEVKMFIQMSNNFITNPKYLPSTRNSVFSKIN